VTMTKRASGYVPQLMESFNPLCELPGVLCFTFVHMERSHPHSSAYAIRVTKIGFVVDACIPRSTATRRLPLLLSIAKGQRASRICVGNFITCE
jgi:hypothetical protein